MDFCHNDSVRATHNFFAARTLPQVAGWNLVLQCGVVSYDTLCIRYVQMPTVCMIRHCTRYCVYTHTHITTRTHTYTHTHIHTHTHTHTHTHRCMRGVVYERDGDTHTRIIISHSDLLCYAINTATSAEELLHNQNILIWALCVCVCVCDVVPVCTRGNTYGIDFSSKLNYQPCLNR